MSVEQLTHKHIDLVKPLFLRGSYMGVSSDDFSVSIDGDNFEEFAYTAFCDTYMNGLKNFKAFGYLNNGNITSFISFYESIDTPDWYWTQIRSLDHHTIPVVLDKVMHYNEKNGRLKFYTMFNKKYSKSYRRLAFSKTAKERYDFFDEYIVPAKTKAIAVNHWQILYNRTLLPVDSIVRCTFLKQEYRDIPIGGFL